MEIKEAKYFNDPDTKKPISINVIDGNDVKWGVPLNPANSDYAEILKQVKEGKLTIKDAE
jgi:predicted neuraminidase